MFEQLVPAIERFRERRRALEDKSQRLLLSETIVFGIPAHLHVEANRLMGWPNWLGFLIKELYTPKAIVFGFIRQGVSELSTEGDPMPLSPFHAVVIRRKSSAQIIVFLLGMKPCCRPLPKPWMMAATCMPDFFPAYPTFGIPWPSA